MKKVQHKCKPVKRKNVSTNSSFFQAKLKINQPDDPYEREADSIADSVMNKHIAHNDLNFFKAKSTAITSIQRKVNGEYCNARDMNSVNQTLHSIGHPLDNATKSFMEQRFGHDFKDVQIHNDSLAHQSSTDINALAYTHGNHIVFGKGQYQSNTSAGKQLLAHELTHVIQQQNGTAIQRKEDPKVTLARETLEDDIDAFQIAYNLKYVFAGFNEKQKEPIKAIKTGDTISITIGQSYMDEGDEDTRKAWIKTEIVDKFIKVDRFEDVAKDPTHSKLHEINPPYGVGSYCTLNCPATAASLSEYLQSGTINPAYCNPAAEKGKGYGFEVSMNTFTKSFTWKQAEAAIRAQLKKHGDFVVVEATRSAEQMKKHGLAQNHYFTVVNVKGKLFAIDASMGGIIRDDLHAYIEVNVIATSYRLVKGQFKVKLVLPK